MLRFLFPPGRIATVLGVLTLFGLRYTADLDLWVSMVLLGAGLAFAVMADVVVSRRLARPAVQGRMNAVGELEGPSANAALRVPEAEPAREHRSGECPRCRGVALQSGACPACLGRVWDPGAVEAFARNKLHLDRLEDLRELADLSATSTLRCPTCSGAMKEVRLKGELVDLCRGCGSLWADDGETARIERAVDAAASTSQS